MKSKLLKIEGVVTLNRENQKNILGGVSGNVDLSKCGCSCSGSVTGPFYCSRYFACPQVYTCDDNVSI
ncbi:hypothetical protein [Flavobacterium sp.]|uniref:hypothetical protein n=1 Tax=Flavobacterium sp. TaxID=239 RepID=UPI004047B0F8